MRMKTVDRYRKIKHYLRQKDADDSSTRPRPRPRPRPKRLS